MNSTSNNTLNVGAMLDEKWVILEFIAKGGMGEVYRAHQVNLKRDVVIKIVSTEWLESCEEDEEENHGNGMGTDRHYQVNGMVSKSCRFSWPAL